MKILTLSVIELDIYGKNRRASSLYYVPTFFLQSIEPLEVERLLAVIANTLEWKLRLG